MSSGKFDTTFGGGDGIAPIAPFPRNDLEQATMALRPDGKIIVAEENGDTVRRYRADGSLDTAFGTKGIVSINAKTSLNHFFVAKVLRQSDGRIVVAGTEFASSQLDGGVVAVVRLLGSGQIDKSYGGGDGLVTTAVHAPRADGAGSAALQSDGRLVVVGGDKAFDNTHKQGQFAVRYNTNGTLDKSFNKTGIREFVYLSDDDFSKPELAVRIAIKPDGKIDIAGSAWTPDRPRFAVIQLKVDGSDDTTFGKHARAFVGTSTEDAQADLVDAIAITPDNKIVLAGAEGEPGDTGELPEIARLT